MLLTYPRHTYSESAGIKQNQPEWRIFQNSRHIREGIANPVTLEAEWAGMTANGNSLYSYRYAIRGVFWITSGLIRGPIGTFRLNSSRIERQSKDSDDIWIAFQLNSFNIEIDSGSNRDPFEVHSGSFEAHSGHSDRIWSGLPFRFSFEGDQNVSNAVGMP